MTQLLEVITKYCDVYVDDARLKQKKATDQPLYAREMWGYLLPAISLFTLPSEMPEYLFGTESNPMLVEPKFADTQYTLETEATGDFSVSLGEDFAGYEICSCRLKVTDEGGYTQYYPLEINYDTATGNVTVSAGETLAAGSVLDFDFYTDGYFENTLSPRVKNILGKCFQTVWQNRFNTDWLSIVTKVDDKSFTEQNRASKMNADTERLIQIDAELAGELRKFEQDVYRRNHIKSSLKI